jgi:LmbE family N-acetylglucosaminyl deacetylase
LKKLLYFFAILCLLILGSVMVSGARTSWSIHQGNGRMQRILLSEFPQLQEGQRLLIVSPHPDDETLGCAGLIREARDRNIPVSVVIVTNGDAYPMAVQRQYRRMRPRPSDYIRFGELRQKETREALRRLGVDSRHVTFLGYPDRGLSSLWMSHWKSASPYASFTTRVSRNPYPATFHPGAVYAGQSLADDMARLIERIRPTDLFFTHPDDDHPDHAYLGCFVTAALEKLGWHQGSIAVQDGRFASEPSAMQTVRLHTFIVHHGDWPVPQGYRTEERLPPPVSMSMLDTRWRAFDLDSDAIAAKANALRAYKSQIDVPPGGRFLFSFVRRNELFGDLNFLLKPDSRVCGPRYMTPWLFAPDSVNDKVVRELQAGADIKELAVARNGSSLVVRLVARGNLSRWARYRINLHRLNAARPDKPGILRLSARYRGKPPSAVGSFSWSGDTLEARIPLKNLGDPSRIMANAETFVGGIQVDSSAWRGFDLD